MPQPTISDVHIDAVLTNLSVRFTLQTDAFVSYKVFPKVNVQHRSGKFWTFDRSYFLRSDAQLRAPGTESAGSGFVMGSDSYFCDVYAMHKDIDDQTRANADSQIRLDATSVEFVTQHLLQRREQAWVSQFFATGVWTTDVTPVNKWDDYANGDPIADLRLAIMVMAETTGMKPNTLVLSPEVWNKIQDHPDLLERIKFTERGIVGTELLSSLIGIDKTYIPWAIKNTAAEGVTAVYDFIYPKGALLLYVPKSPGLDVVSAGYTFLWSGFIGSGDNGIRMKRFRMEQIASERIEGEEALDQKVISPELGYFFNAAVA